jgi:transposase
LIYLPPYSPDYNPIEECFSFIKAYIRRNGHIFRDLAESRDWVGSFQFLYHALDMVTPEAANGWFHHSGYL